jgi:AcrR family transcriptional regulator
MSRLALKRDTPLTIAEITQTALHLADREGIDALSMRRLATELNVSTMAVYHHFANKAELLQAVTHEIWLEGFAMVNYDETDPIERLVSVCVSIRKAFAAHSEFAFYAVASPRASETLDQVTAASATLLRETGLPEADIPFAFECITSHTLGTALMAARRKQIDATLAQEQPTYSDPGLPGPYAEQGANDPLRHDIRKAMETDESLERFERGLRALIAGIFAQAQVHTQAR